MARSKPTLESILRERNVGSISEKRVLQETIALAVSEYLDSHDVITGIGIMRAVVALVEDDTIGLIRKSKGWKYYSDGHQYWGSGTNENPYLRDSNDFKRKKLGEVVQEAARKRYRPSKGCDVAVTYRPDEDGSAEEIPMHHKTPVYYKSNTKLMSYVRSGLSARPVKVIFAFRAGS